MSHGAFVAQISGQIAKMADFKVDIQVFLDMIVGDAGILSKLNCAFVGTGLQRFLDALCVQFVPSFWNITFIMGMFGCSAYCSMCCAFCVNRRYAIPVRKV